MNTNPEKEIIRKSFGLKDRVKSDLETAYNSSLIDQIRDQEHKLQSGRVTFCLAKEFGFCYGVDRAIDYAYETKVKFPNKRIFLTNEIIHNPRVNAKMSDRGIQFLSGSYAGPISLDEVNRDDVVLMPAFGVTLKELEELKSKGCVVVDTTCGSVMSVWKRVESYSRDGFTSIIHGKYDHEETKATSSRAVQYPEGKYLVVRDKDQAAIVCDYICSGQDKQAFLGQFQHAVSEGFDPDRDLARIGCANQTTMLSSESLEIAGMLREAIVNRYGAAEVESRFRHFDTICSATQERQDAVYELIREKPNLMLVVGGFNSSNTGHLAEISSEYCPSFHINDASCLISGNQIRHKKVFSSEIVKTAGWLPSGEIKIGLTSGASTPNRILEEVIERLLEIENSSPKG